MVCPGGVSHSPPLIKPIYIYPLVVVGRKEHINQNEETTTIRPFFSGFYSRYMYFKQKIIELVVNVQNDNKNLKNIAAAKFSVLSLFHEIVLQLLRSLTCKKRKKRLANGIIFSNIPLHPIPISSFL
jgi:hypothetical protein